MISSANSLSVGRINPIVSEVGDEACIQVANWIGVSINDFRWDFYFGAAPNVSTVSSCICLIKVPKASQICNY
jgi:hypothetical protein